MSLDAALREALREALAAELPAALATALADATEPRPLALTLAETAQRTGLSERTLRRAIADGRLRAIRAGRSVRVPILALDEFVGAA
jgi:excisionase family DNA binding protein